MAETPRLDLPYLSASQAQKEIQHNISLDRLDMLVQCAVIDRNLTTPPASPALGDAYICATGSTGAWAGHDQHLALWISSQWQFIAPLPGFTCWVNDEAALVYWSGTAWVIASGGGGASTFLGLSDTPDTYSGQAGKAVLVNPGGTALEFGTSGGGAPVDATYIVSSANATLSAERVLTNSTSLTWNTGTPAQVTADIAANGVTLDKIEQLAFPSLLGRGNAPDGNAEEISIGPGLTLTAGTLSLTAAPGAADFLSLTDTPDSYSGQAGKAVVVNAGATALEFGTAGGGVSDFLALTDTPDTYTGQGGKVVAVNAGATALEFITGGGGESHWTRADTAVDTLTTGLLAFWRMEETSGNRVDSVAAMALVPQGAAASGVGKHGNAAQLNGAAGAYFSIADNVTLSIGPAQNFSIVCWVCFDAAPVNNSCIVGKGDTNSTYDGAEFMVWIDTGTVRLVVGNGSVRTNVNSTFAPVVGTWFLVMGWFDAAANVLAIQINDSAPVSVTCSHDSYDSAAAFEVGRTPGWSGAPIINARVDDVMFYKRTLTTEERTALWQSGAGLDFPALGTGTAYVYPTVSTDLVLAGASAPTAAEPLESARGMKLGNSSSTVDGVIRWTGSDIEARKGGAWTSLTTGVTTFLALTDTPDVYAANALKILCVNAAATAVEFSDSLTLGGAGAGLAQLSVRGNTAASGEPSLWASLRLYPHTSAASTDPVGLRIEAPQVSGAGTLQSFQAIQILDPVSVPSPQFTAGIASNVTAGSNRYNLYAAGTAPNYFAGPLALGTTLIMDQGSRITMSFDKAAGHNGMLVRQLNDTGGGQPLNFHNGANTPIGSISTTATATAYNTSSDVRLKNSITPLIGALTRVRALRPVSFRWNADDSPGIGFLAHELQVHVPEAVMGEPDAVNDDGSIRPQGVDHSKIVPWLVSAVQELSAQVQSLTARVADLEAALA